MKKLRITVEGRSYDVEVEVLEDDETGGSSYGFPVARPTAAAPPPAPAARPPAAESDAKDLTSPIAGTVVEVQVKAGDKVNQDDPIVVLEAMKMNTSIRAHVAGSIHSVLVKPGDTVQQGQPLVRFD